MKPAPAQGDHVVATETHSCSGGPLPVLSDGLLDAELSPDVSAERRRIAAVGRSVGETSVKAEPCCSSRPERAKSAAPLSALGVASTVAALLVPKCPLCLAAYLTLFGLGAGWAAAVAPLVRPVALAVSLVAFAALVVVAVRRRRWRSASGAGANDHVTEPPNPKEIS